MNEQLKIIISAEVARAKQGIKQAQDSVKTFKDKVAEAKKDVSEKFQSIGTAIHDAAGKVATGVAAAAGALLALGASTEEYRQNQALLKTAFENANGSAEQATQTYNDLYRVLGDGGQATEAAQHLAKLTTEEQALSEWATICQGVYSTFGASLPIESLTEAANETAKTGELTGALADALNWAGVGEEEFQAKLSACNTEAEREALIRQTLNGLYADAAANYEENNAKILAQRDAQANLQAQLGTLGEAMTPIQTAFTNFGATLLEKINPYITLLADTLLPKLQPALDAVATAVETAIQFIADNWGIISAVAGVIMGIVAAIELYNAVQAVKAAMDAAQVATLGGLIAAHVAQAAAAIAAIAPYLLIVAAIAAVIAIIVLCVKHWDEIKAKVKEVWDNMKQKISEVAKAIEDKVKSMVEGVKEWFGNMKENITTKVEEAKAAVSEKFEAVKTAVSEKVAAAKEAAVSKFNEIKTNLTNAATTAYSNIKGKFGDIADAVKSKLETAKNTATSIFDNIKKTMTDKIEAAKTAVSSVIEKIKGFFDFKFKLPSIPSPHFSINPQGWSVGDLLQGVIPSLGISWYAKGGVFDTPTLFAYGNGSLGGLGERGAEAVVPLENNLGWLDKLATMLNDRLGTNQNIVLNVDGKRFAEISVDSINNLTRQRGSIPLVIA